MDRLVSKICFYPGGGPFPGDAMGYERFKTVNGEAGYHDAGVGRGAEGRDRRRGSPCEPVALSDPARTAVQKKHCWPASKIVPTSLNGVTSGSGCASRAWALSPIVWSLSTRPVRQRR